eukprot:TRINITY_DN7686_c0_g1_i1.p1 TRINITY_DN7686_c0_g1~~TRINITY_DN7686_c0_g1_i1.p1  ORF type:complete len:201 (+),score=34.17 TRINITY_DN7686_c0_g1_i1:241-843(+)
MDPSYGMYLWPSAILLADYLCINARQFDGKKILELGTGTGLCGLIAALIGGEVVMTDLEDSVIIRENCQWAIQHNKHLFKGSARYLPFTWNAFSPSILELSAPDIILGADVLYDESDFEILMASVHFFLQKNPHAIFLTTYQERVDSYRWTIEILLDRWNLEMEDIPIETFFADDRTDLLQGKTISLWKISNKSVDQGVG